MSARRWSKFWWQDWQRDPALRMCSLAARGAWIEMLCLMADANPVGHLLVNGRAPSMRQLSAVLGCSEKEAKKLVDELEENGVFSRLEDGVIYSRRMVRDKAISDEAAINGKKGGNPQIKQKPRGKVKPDEGKGLTPPDNPEATPTLKHQEAEAEADILSSLRSERERVDAPLALVGPDEEKPSRTPQRRKSRLGEDWQPSADELAYAAELGLDGRAVGEKFRLHWLAKGETKLDWHAAFQLWCRREHDFSPRRGGQIEDNRPKTASQRADEHAARMIEKYAGASR